MKAPCSSLAIPAKRRSSAASSRSPLCSRSWTTGTYLRHSDASKSMLLMMSSSFDVLNEANARPILFATLLSFSLASCQWHGTSLLQRLHSLSTRRQNNDVDIRIFKDFLHICRVSKEVFIIDEAIQMTLKTIKLLFDGLIQTEKAFRALTADISLCRSLLAETCIHYSFQTAPDYGSGHRVRLGFVSQSTNPFMPANKTRVAYLTYPRCSCSLQVP